MPAQRLFFGRARGGGLLIAGADPAERRRLLKSLDTSDRTRTIAVGLDSHLTSRVAALGPSVVLFHVTYRPDVKVFSTIAALSALSKVVVVAEADDDALAIRALKAGACGFCAHGTPPRLMRRAIQLVEDGEIWVGRRVMLRLIEELARLRDSGPAEPAAAVRLTGRETAIARMVGRGAGNKDIAAALAISVKTVKTHLTNVFKKLGVSSRLQLALAVGVRPSSDQGRRDLRPIARARLLMRQPQG